METSTGVGHDIEGIGRAVKENSKALFVVDGISGVGAMECRTDAWGIDVLVVGSQKALMTPPGLAFLAVSPAAWKQIEANPNRPAFYFDLLAYRKALATSDTPYTPAIPLVIALAESLKILRAEGMESIWKRTRILAAALRAGIEALGLKLTAARPADGMTAVFFPEGIDGKAFSGSARKAVRHQTGRRPRTVERQNFPHRPFRHDRRIRRPLHPRRPGIDAPRVRHRGRTWFGGSRRQ